MKIISDFLRIFKILYKTYPILFHTLCFSLGQYKLRYLLDPAGDKSIPFLANRLFHHIKKPSRVYFRYIKYYITNNQLSDSAVCLDIDMDSIAESIFAVVGNALFCERMNTNIKFYFNNWENPFENSVLRFSNKKEFNCTGIIDVKSPFQTYAKASISSEYGYKIISQMEIKKEFCRQADKLISDNLEGDWIGVHYRGTDLANAKYRWLTMKSYITYLKETIDDHCNIFVCSDISHFIEQMDAAFPGRTFSRDIIRSDGIENLHFNFKYSGKQQKDDAFMDLLVLSKASLVYTTGSVYVDATRFLNPEIKIISLDDRASHHKNIPNYLPVKLRTSGLGSLMPNKNL